MKRSSENYKFLRVNGANLPYLVERRKVRYPRLEFRAGELLVILPNGWGDEKLLLRRKIGWISKKHSDIQKAIEKFSFLKEDGPGLLVMGEFFKFQASDGLKIDFSRKLIKCDINNQNHLRQLVSLLKEKLLEELKSVAREYSEKLCVKFNRIFIRMQKTKWGSCSSKGNLNFNFWLVCLPRELIRYVVYHEVLHLKERRHDKAFWRAIEGEFRDYKQMEESLFEYWFFVQEHSRSVFVSDLL